MCYHNTLLFLFVYSILNVFLFLRRCKGRARKRKNKKIITERSENETFIDLHQNAAYKLKL